MIHSITLKLIRNFTYILFFYSRGPSRKTVRRRLGIAYHQYRQQLRTAFAHIDAIALTIDLWTKNKTSFICLTGHAFNKAYESIPTSIAIFLFIFLKKFS